MSSISDVRPYLEIPYAFNGRSWQGADCYGLLILWYRHELGIDLLDYKHDQADFRDFNNSHYLIENAHNEFAGVTLEAARQNDVLLIRNDSGTPNHCGIVLGRRFLHTLHQYGPVTSKISTWRSRIHGVYRHKRFI